MESVDVLVFVANTLKSPKSDLVDMLRALEFISELEHTVNASALKAVEYLMTCDGIDPNTVELGPELVAIASNRLKDVTTSNPRMSSSEYQSYCNVVDWHRLIPLVRDIKDKCLERVVGLTNSTDRSASQAATFCLMYGGTTQPLSGDGLLSLIDHINSNLSIEHNAHVNEDCGCDGKH